MESSSYSISAMTNRPTTIYRSDNDVWEMNIDEETLTKIKKIGIRVKSIQDTQQAYALVSALFTHLFSHNEKEPYIKNIYRQDKGIIRITDQASQSLSTTGNWAIKVKKAKTVGKLAILYYFLPFLRKIPDNGTLQLSIKSKKTRVWYYKLLGVRTSTLSKVAIDRFNPIQIREPLQSNRLKRALEAQNFQDPYTSLAIECFTKFEPFFVMEQENRGSYKYLVHEKTGKIQLKKIDRTKPQSETEKEENRTIIRKYRDFFSEEYGLNFLNRLRDNYGINFEKMAAEGAPLYPDHISKCNIAAQDIQITDADNLYKRLYGFYTDPDNHPISEILSVREARGLTRVLRLRSDQIEEPYTIQNLLESLFPSPDRSPDLFDTLEVEEEIVLINQTEEICSNIISMLMPTNEERERSLTGRKIQKAIMGFNTMGNPDIPCPIRNMFELLHIFDNLQTCNVIDYYQLLSHVASKKSLFRKDENGRYYAGLILPGARKEDGADGDEQLRWSYCKVFIDDDCGSVSYILTPLGNDSTNPIIFLYRSTASDKNAISYFDSLIADLKKSAPGSLDPSISYEYQKKHIFENSIPIWVGYLLAAKLYSPLDCVDEAAAGAHDQRYTHAIVSSCYELKSYCQEHGQRYPENLDTLLKNNDYHQAHIILLTLAKEWEEDPESKKSRGMVFAGHSLGGALAQSNTFYNLARINRCPLPDQSCLCYSTQAPATDNESDKQFMEYIHKHQSIFKTLHISWSVHHQFEYGDIVPQAGGSHLGTNLLDKKIDDAVFHFFARACRPNSCATDIEITTAQTHGRRFSSTPDLRQYREFLLNRNELYAFDHAFHLSSDLAQKFGVGFFNSPKTIEWIRNSAGAVISPLLKFINKKFIEKKEDLAGDGGIIYALPNGWSEAVEKTFIGRQFSNEILSLA
ncbi:MAG: hypothetical protein QRY74_04335 [Chlamydia sp.]